MPKMLKFYAHYCERRDEHKYAHAYILDELPNVGDHISLIYNDEVVLSRRIAMIDVEQPSRDVFDYNIYEIEICDADNEEDIDYIYVAVLSHEDLDEEVC